MDTATNSFEAYVLFSAPRECEPSGRQPPDGSSLRRHRRQPPLPVGWLIGGFYGAILGALMLGVTAGIDAHQVIWACPTLLAVLMAVQAGLVLRPGRTQVAVRIAQTLSTPALALMIAGLGGLARLPA
jgi:hypothetical protein